MSIHFLILLISFLLFVYYIENSATRRQQANLWLQEMVGDLGLTCDSTEEDLRLCLRNGLTLCKLINKVQPEAVLKVSKLIRMCLLVSFDRRALFVAVERLNENLI